MKPSLKLQADRMGAVVLAAIGGLFLLIGWLRISDTPYPAEQLPYILSGGIGGIFFLGLGATLWISSDLRDEWTTFDRIEDALRDLAGERAESSESLATAGTGELVEAPSVVRPRRRGARKGRVTSPNGATMSESTS